jgi:hypothetical protein
MGEKLMWIIAGFGTVALIGSFWRMKAGFGPFNLRVVGIILVGTFATLLALQGGETITAAMGILGAIVRILVRN